MIFVEGGEQQSKNWDNSINGVIFAYRTLKQKLTQFTPFELMYCRHIKYRLVTSGRYLSCLECSYNHLGRTF